MQGCEDSSKVPTFLFFEWLRFGCKSKDVKIQPILIDSLNYGSRAVGTEACGPFITT